MTPLFDIDLEQCSTFFLTCHGLPEKKPVQAKKRNPNIKLYGLAWAFPSWVGNGSGDPFKFPELTARYLTEWVSGAKSEYGRHGCKTTGLEKPFFSCGKKTCGVLTKLKRSQGGQFFGGVFGFGGLNLYSPFMFAHGTWWKTRSIPTPCMEGPSVEAWCGLFGYLEWKGLRQ